MNLAPNQAHVWIVQAGEFCAAAKGGEAWLTPAERERIARFQNAGDRQLHLAGRMFQRWVLSQYAPVSPADWVFGNNAYGKPHVQAPASARELSFNLSHTAGWVAGVVTLSRPAGIDIETFDARVEPLALCDRFFAPAESAALRSVGAANQRAAFFRFWTLKEAYVKARGLGLSLPLDKFAFDLGAPLWRLSVADETRAQSAQWRFAALEVDATHAAAVCVLAQTDSLELVRYKAGPELKPARIALRLRGASDGITGE